MTPKQIFDSIVKALKKQATPGYYGEDPRPAGLDPKEPIIRHVYADKEYEDGKMMIVLEDETGCRYSVVIKKEDIRHWDCGH